MYTVSKGPASIVQKTRRANICSNGSPLDADLHDEAAVAATGKTSRKSKNTSAAGPAQSQPSANSSSLSVVFQPTSFPRRGISARNSQEKFSAQYEDSVRFVNNRWRLVREEIDRKSSSVTVYADVEPSPALVKGFEPFDLESWWGQRLYKRLTQGAP